MTVKTKPRPRRPKLPKPSKRRKKNPADTVDIRFAIATPASPGPIKILCPFHDDVKPSMAVYDNGTWCFRCGRGEYPDQFLERVGVKPEGLPKRSEARKAVAFAQKNQDRQQDNGPTFDRLEVMVGVWQALLDGKRAGRKRWLVERGLSTDAIREHRLGHTGESFVIPVLSPVKGDVLGVKFRSDPEYVDMDDPMAEKYTSPYGQRTLVYRPNIRGTPTVITEGEFDALVLAQLGIDGITTTSGADSLARKIRPDRLDNVYVATDLDPGGDDAYRTICRRFGRALPRVRWPDGKDVTDALQGVLIGRERLFRDWIREAAPEHELLDD